MKKIVIVIFILFILFSIMSSIQIFNILTTEIQGLPDAITQVSYEKNKILYILWINLWLFIMLSLLIICINNFYLKKHK